jgi:hypothetical protein
LEESRKIDHDGTVFFIGLADGVEWTSDNNEALTVEGRTHVLIRNVGMSSTDGSALECRHYSECVLEEVTLHDSRRQGIRARDQSETTMERSIVVGNEEGGIRIESSATVRLTNVLVVRNGVDGRGFGGIYLTNGDATLEAINCTIADNDAEGRSAGVHVDGDPMMTLVNLILWSNTGDEPECDRCLLGTDSLEINPEFVISEGARLVAEDYMIQATSLAVDNGIVTADTPNVDYWGDARDALTPDSGADEFVP